ncbi:MAG: M20/M25/M40 family metallo-hydrolase [Candidatus Sumerlaeales bacterium]|nr:M20/M25/M40 family metallo-hydrolase [Candidatus Sumerlaeales bacterium]
MSNQVVIDDVIALASALVSRLSENTMGLAAPDGSQVSFALWLADYLRAIGADSVETASPNEGLMNVLGVFDFACSETIIYTVHLDTVPVIHGEYDVWFGQIHNGSLWGRGSCDNKGSMACMLTALRRAKAGAFVPRYNVLFIATSDEEHAFLGVRNLTEVMPEKLRLIRNQMPFAAFVAEPTQCRPIIAHKGVTRWRAIARGKSAHSSTPQLGKNAITYMSKFIVQLDRKAQELQSDAGHPLLGHATLSPGVISGGTAVNIVPDLCSLDIDRRLLPGETPESATGELDTLARACGVVLGPPIMWGMPLETASDARVSLMAAAASEAVGAADSSFGWVNFATDASFFSVVGVPAVVMGAGDIAYAHTREEHIEVPQLEMGARLFEEVLAK